MSLNRADILSALQGQPFTLPDFATLYHDWPTTVSPHLDWLRSEVTARLRWTLSHTKTVTDRRDALARLEAADFGYLTATLWPDEPRENLKVLAYCMIWLCLWADGVALHFGSPGRDSNAHIYRQETLDFAAEALGLTKTKSISQTVLITGLLDVIEPILDVQRERRRDLYRELENYVRATAIEQDRQLRRWLPKADDYLHVRLSTSSVGFLLALHGLLSGRQVYESVAAQMTEMTFLVNMMTTITNDVLSLKEEVSSGTTYSLIPVLWQETRSLQGAINRSYRMLEEARARFDELELELLRDHPDVPRAAMKQFIRVSKTYCTGTLNWGMRLCQPSMSKLNGDKRGKYRVML